MSGKLPAPRSIRIHVPIPDYIKEKSQALKQAEDIGLQMFMNRVMNLQQDSTEFGGGDFGGGGAGGDYGDLGSNSGSDLGNSND